MSTEARDRMMVKFANGDPAVQRAAFNYGWGAGWDARGQAIKDDPRIPEVNKAWVFDPVGMKAATNEIRTERRRARGQVTPDHDEIAKVVNPNAFRDTLPWLPGEQMRQKTKARKRATAILALFNEKGNE